MTTREYIHANPKAEDESIRAYARRAADVLGTSPDHVRQMYRQMRNSGELSLDQSLTMQEVGRTEDGKGKVTSRRLRRVDADMEAIPSGFSPQRISRNEATGQEWRIYRKDGYGIAREDIDAALVSAFENIDRTPYRGTQRPKTDRVLMVVYADVHVGMETDKDGHGLYGGVWNADVLEERRRRMIDEVRARWDGHEVVAVDLGDFMDGWDGQTVRRGHDLPQNMDNREAFNVGVRFKLDTARDLLDLTDRVRFWNVCNDNHAGDFGYVVNRTAQMATGADWSNCLRFMSHFTVGDHAFIITHGKDAKNLKFGFKPVLDHKQADKVSEYIRHHRLDRHHVTLLKGDSHQYLFDRRAHFNYLNVWAFSPASEWVQTNFTKGRSGFVILEFDKARRDISAHPVEFEWSGGDGSGCEI